MFDGAKDDSGSLELDQVLSESSSITSLQFKGNPRGEYCPTNLTPWKKHVGDCIGHIAEIMCSSADVNAVEKELKYSSGNYEEN